MCQDLSKGKYGKKNSALKRLPCLDSPEMAQSNRGVLDIPYEMAEDLGLSAVQTMDLGWYINSAGDKVELSRLVEHACKARLSIPPDARLPEPEKSLFNETRIQVRNETTLHAAQRLVEKGLRPIALNFANGVHPGGGFLSGARAQEEVLCRSSALYHTLVGDPMYTYHAERPLPDSSDWVIYSPDVPIFRSDDGTELDRPWLLSFLTCAAPYAPSVGQPKSGALIQKRILRILSIASAYGYEVLVLGAWGCGAFANDTMRTANDFRQALEINFSGHFSEVVFAITDWSEERSFLGPFRDVFS